MASPDPSRDFFGLVSVSKSADRVFETSATRLGLISRSWSKRIFLKLAVARGVFAVSATHSHHFLVNICFATVSD